eukprot:TRINITY_DN502_c0_g3_i1.p1 TRINITY_DN502_c0_g3~~TRINITY_DN502_c0_g3_i1.p1  ORF type:complete len:207 (-),score=37.65 TRINITY_DN502_c0_g3_i1:53-673(-)
MQTYTSDLSLAQRSTLIITIERLGGVPAEPKESGYVQTLGLAQAVLGALDISATQLCIWLGRQEKSFSDFLSGQPGKRNEADAFAKWIQRNQTKERNYAKSITLEQFEARAASRPQAVAVCRSAQDPAQGTPPTDQTPSPHYALGFPPLEALACPEESFQKVPGAPSAAGAERELLLQEIAYLLQACRVRGDPAIKALIHQKIDLL